MTKHVVRERERGKFHATESARFTRPAMRQEMQRRHILPGKRIQAAGGITRAERCPPVPGKGLSGRAHAANGRLHLDAEKASVINSPSLTQGIDYVFYSQ
jgi:hypothetical protein